MVGCWCLLSIFNLLLTRLSSTSGSDVELGRPIPVSASRQQLRQVRYAQARSVTSRARSIMTPHTPDLLRSLHLRPLHRCSSSQYRLT